MNQNDIFRTVLPEDFNITPFKTYKRWSYTSSSYADNGIQIIYATGSQGTNINDEVYNLVNHLYYSNAISQSIGSLYNYFADYSTYTTLSLDEKCIFFGIPQQLYGERIKPGTVSLTYSTQSLIDDKKGNLRKTNGEHVGNVFYSQGNIVITNTGSVYTEFDSGSTFTLSYNGELTIYEYEVNCYVSKGDLTTTTNPSLYSGSQGFPLIFTDGQWTGSTIYNINGAYSGSTIFNTTGFDPYISTIGLYDDNYNLLAIGKLAKPTKNDKNLDMMFTVKIDV